MKKNRMMRLASVLLVLVLLTTSVISGTFAKYTTQDSASDAARVAKWGVELQVVGNLFGASYKDNIVITKEDTDDTITVQASDWYNRDAATDVVAPGTANPNGFTFSLNGKPEVDGKVTTTMKIQNVFLKAGTYGVMIQLDNGIVNENTISEFDGLYYFDYNNNKFVQTEVWVSGYNYFTLEDETTFYSDYYPVVYTLKDKTQGATTDDSLLRAANAIATRLGLEAAPAATDTSITYTGVKEFETNTDLAGWDVDGETLTWAWAFEQGMDGADTILGMLKNTSGVNTKVVKLDADGKAYVDVVEYTDYCLNTQFSIDITVTQVD